LITINPLPVIAVSLVAWIIFRYLVNQKSGGVYWLREILLNVLFIYGWVVIAYTLFPLDFYLFELDFHGANLVPFAETIRFLNYWNAPGVKRNLLGNLLLLAPLGVLLPLLFRRFRNLWSLLGFGFLTTLTIEVAQLTMRYRVFDIDDLILNLLGVFAGFVLFSLIRIFPGMNLILDRVTDYPHRVTRAYGVGFVGFMTLIALGSASFSFLQNTADASQIVARQVEKQLTPIGQSYSGKYLTVLTQHPDGNVNAIYYRQTLFSRYAEVSTCDNLTLSEDTFLETGSFVVGEYQDIFVIARSQIPAAVMISQGEQFAVDHVGEYSLSIGRFLMKGFVGSPKIGFLDADGNPINLIHAE